MGGESLLKGVQNLVGGSQACPLENFHSEKLPEGLYCRCSIGCNQLFIVAV